MKKILLFAAAAAMVFTSCIKSGDRIPEDQSTVTVKISGLTNPSSRAEAPGTATAGTFTGGYVFLIDPSSGDVIHCEELTSAAATTTGQLLTNSTGGFFNASSTVYVLGNVPADVDPESFTTLDEIKEAESAIIYDAATPANNQNTTFAEPAMANVTGDAVALSGTAAGIRTAEVTIAPLFARIELKGVAAQLSGASAVLGEAFKVTGVYLDKYLPSFTLAGEGAGAIKSNSSTIPVPSGWFCEENAAGWASTGMGPGIANPGTGQVWAFHAGPSAAVPTMFIALSEVKDADGVLIDGGTGVGYLTIGGYTEGSSAGGATFSGAFQRGKIYSVGLVTITDVNQITTRPNPDEVTVTANVTVQPWEIVNLMPVLGE
jgi:hypothetical protein